MAEISMVYPQYVWAKEYIFPSLEHGEKDREMFQQFSTQTNSNCTLSIFGFARFSASNSSGEVHR